MIFREQVSVIEMNEKRNKSCKKHYWNINRGENLFVFTHVDFL